MLSLYSLGSGWPCVRNPLCLCWWECPWVDGWMEGSVRFSLPCWGGFLSCPASKLLSVPLLVGIALESWAALCQNQEGMLLQVRTPLCSLLVGMPLDEWLALSRPLDVRTVSWVLTPQGLSMGIPHPQEFTMGISSILTLPGTN